MIIDGKKIAGEILEALPKDAKLTLGVVMDAGNAASRSFVKMKEHIAERIGITLARFAPEEFDKAQEHIFLDYISP